MQAFAKAARLERRPFIARWDLDKTYLRTDFDTVRDLLRTAVERPDQKRTVPGAAALLRELGRAGVETHILSGSPEQLRGRIEEKLRLDGVRYASLTLKPNLQNILRLRFRALRGQLGYKLPALLLRRCELRAQRDDRGGILQEALLGDDAEADAFVYSLYADVVSGAIGLDELAEILRRGRAYDDTVGDALRWASYIDEALGEHDAPVVERVLIHLDRQSSPADFRMYGARVVPFYNYLQATLVLFEDGRLPAASVLRVAADLVVVHNFERSALARSFIDLHRRGHVSVSNIDALDEALADRLARGRPAAASELVAMLEALRPLRQLGQTHPAPSEQPVDYLALVEHHDPRRSARKR